ncbi:MAG TPA: hypothetical protein VNJ08_08615 [Bacteriovoracaceae bacterium]|nr:hypothetical protein [Bacteriovoracaceae bacterium]
MKSIPLLDSTQDLFGDRLNALANRMDSFFATERADDELGRTSIRIRQNYIIRERAVPELESRYRFNLRLPHLEEKFRYEYHRDKNKTDKEIVTEKEARSTVRRNKVKEGWTFNADAGVSVAIPPRLTTRARVRRNFDTGEVVHRFAEELTYITGEDGLTEETIFQSDLKLNDTQLLRFNNSKRWRIFRKEFVTTHGPTILHQVSEDTGLSYGFAMINIMVNKVYYVTSYTFSINVRQNLYKNWLYLDFIPGLDFPKQWSFRRTPFVIFQLELLFGG